MAAPKKTAVAPEPPAPEQAAVDGSDTTTDYTRRAGGYVLTDRGWVIEAVPATEADGGDEE